VNFDYIASLEREKSGKSTRFYPNDNYYNQEKEEKTTKLSDQ
jgi:hypothetical protein